MASSKSTARSGSGRSKSANGSTPKAKSGSARSANGSPGAKASSGGGTNAAASRTRAKASRASSAGSKRTSSASGKRARGANAKRTSGASAKRTGAKRTPQGKAKSTSSNGNASHDNGVVDTVKDAASKASGPVKTAARKAKGPAMAVGAAAGVAGGIVLSNRLRRKTVLGVPVPRSLAKKSVSNIDVKSMAKSIGKASEQFAKTSKTVSKDIEHAGDQAERIGKILS